MSFRQDYYGKKKNTTTGKNKYANLENSYYHNQRKRLQIPMTKITQTQNIPRKINELTNKKQKIAMNIK